MEVFYKFLISILFVLISQPPFGESEKILFLVPIATTSEKHFFDPIINKLASIGHNVTVVASSKSKTPENVREIVLTAPDELYKGVANISPYTVLEFMFFDMTFFANAIDKLYSNADFQNVVLNQKYDLIFSSALFAQGFYGIIYQNQAPFILINSFPVANSLFKDIGLYSPSSITPHPLIDYTNVMTFTERLQNSVLDWISYLYGEYVYVPMLEAVYRKHLGQHLPSVKEIQKNVSLIMTNTHFTSTYHRPLMPDVIEIGGIHCKPAEPLPNELETFVSASNAPDGFIFISFGTVLNSTTLPLPTRRRILNVMSRLKQRVVWKWESEQMDDLPKNVMLKKWLPQQDLLGHKNIKMFISHAGLLSTQQTIFHGVPVLLFPAYFDQKTNSKYIAEQGFGLKLDIFKSSEKDIEIAVQRVLTETTFKEKAKEVSAIFRDQMNSPAERAAFWTNHILKFKGAPHLRSSARNLNAMQLHSLDVIAFVAGLLLILIYILCYVLRKFFGLLFSGKEKVE